MMIKEECKNFVKLAYLFDYIMLDILRRMFLFSMTDVLKKLDDYNEIPIPVMKENIQNKNGEYIKPQVQNQNRVVPYFLIQCKLENNKPIEAHDYVKTKVKPFFVKATPDDEFDPTAHIMIDKEEQEYQKQLREGKSPQDIINSGVTQVNTVDDIEVQLINRPHHYFISYEPDYEQLKSKFEKEINETLSELKVKGWRAHPRFRNYLKYMDDWDEKYGEYLIQNEYVDTVIQLPANLFFGVGIATCIIVLKRGKKKDGNVLFINASNEYVKNGNKNLLQQLKKNKR